jgi:hypothetical protein
MVFILFGIETDYIGEKDRLNKNLTLTHEFFVAVSSSNSYSIRS